MPSDGDDRHGHDGEPPSYLPRAGISVMDFSHGHAQPPRDRREFSVYIDFGFRTVKQTNVLRVPDVEGAA